VRQPTSAGDVSGEVPVTFGSPYPVGFRAAESSRVMRIEPRDYHAVASIAPTVAQEVARLASDRISGPRGLQGVAAEPPPPRAVVVGRRSDASSAELRRFLQRNQISFKWLDADEPGLDEQWGSPVPGDEDLPVMRVMDGETVVRPQLRRAAELLGLQTEPAATDYDTVIVGGGPQASQRRSTAHPRGCGRSRSSEKRPAARRERLRGSRTTSGSRPASRAPT